jgi:hypothetical protein
MKMDRAMLVELPAVEAFEASKRRIRMLMPAPEGVAHG